MKQSVLDSCRDFYITCLTKGRIPVRTHRNKWCCSYDPQDFEDYLARFNAEDRRYITQGLPRPTSRATSRTQRIISSLSKEKVERLLEVLYREDPEIVKRIVWRTRQWRNSPGTTT